MLFYLLAREQRPARGGVARLFTDGHHPLSLQGQCQRSQPGRFHAAPSLLPERTQRNVPRLATRQRVAQCQKSRQYFPPSFLPSFFITNIYTCFFFLFPRTDGRSDGWSSMVTRRCTRALVTATLESCASSSVPIATSPNQTRYFHNKTRTHQKGRFNNLHYFIIALNDHRMETRRCT